MANRIEITVTGKNEMPATFAEIKAQAGALGTQAGADAGEKLTTALGDKVKQDLPPKIQDPIKESGKTSGAAFASAFTGELTSGLSGTGVFGGSIGDAIGKEGDPAGKKFSATFSQAAKDSMVGSTLAGILAPDGEVGAPMVEDAKKTGDKVGKDAGKAAAQGMSPLIIAAIGGAAAIGAPVLLAALGTAFVGVTALALHSNATIAADYTQLGKTAEAAITKAAAPLAGDMHQAVTGLEGDLRTLQPQLDTLFSNVGPDITQVSTGLGAFVSGTLPGLSTAVGNSQVIVKDFANSMGPLGSSVGSFFTGLTVDASTTGAGLQSVFGVLGNTVSTLGGVLGSASSAISADLLGLDPVINGVLAAVKGLANPATVGALGGVFGAMKLDPVISTGLKSASTGMFDLAAKTEGASGLLGKVSGTALSAGTGLEKMAGVMSGPWGLAVGAGVGLLSGLAGAIYESAHASDALTLSQQGLTDAVARDGGQIGSSVTAYVAQQAVTDGLAKSASAAGVSIETWTQAVIGNKAAQQEVTDAVTTTNQSTLNQQIVTDDAAKSTGKFSDESRNAKTSVEAQSVATNKLTDQNKQLLASMDAQNKQIADAITKQAQLTAATTALNNSKQIFNATLASGYQTLVANAQATAMNTVAALDLGANSYDLNQQLYNSVDAYSQAQTEGNAYLSVLDSMSGTINSLLGKEAAFTTSLFNLTKVTKGHTDSLDVNTQAGAANITKITGIANSAKNAAGAVYDNERATKGATQAFNDANAKLEQEKNAFIAAADKAGYNKTQVQQLADELFRLPQNVQVGADVNPALNGLQTLLRTINSSGATVTVYENSSGTVFSSGGGNKAHAAGGPLSFAAVGGPRSGLVTMNEQGRELVIMPTGAQVMPHANTEAILGGLGSSAGGGGKMQLELVSIGDDPWIRALRNSIRIRGGNVQKVLGVN